MGVSPQKTVSTAGVECRDRRRTQAEPGLQRAAGFINSQLCTVRDS